MFSKFFETARNSPFVAHCDGALEEKSSSIIPDRQIAAAAAEVEGGERFFSEFEVKLRDNL